MTGAASSPISAVESAASAVPQTGDKPTVAATDSRNGSTNSRFSLKNETPTLIPDVPSAGVDTWSPAWYIDRDSALARALRELATTPGNGGAWLLPEQVASHGVGWYPKSGMVYAEGHPSLDQATLASPDDLPAILEHIEEEMADRGLQLPAGNCWHAWDGAGAGRHRPTGRARFAGHCGVRRMDATVDLRFETPAAGLAFLNGLAAVAREAPGIQASVRWTPGRHFVQTVSLHGRGGRKMLGRAYDKGVELGTFRPGLLIRLEDQRRFPKDKRRHPEQLDTAAVRGLWHRRFDWLRTATRGVVVISPSKARELLIEMIANETLSYSQAVQVAGYILLERDLDRLKVARATWYRHRKRARETGVVLGDGVFEEGEIDLHAITEAILDSNAWSQRGCQLTLDVPAVEPAPPDTANDAVSIQPEGPARRPEPYWLSAN